MAGQTAQEGAEPFDAAHDALRADSSIQFNLTPPEPPPKLPEWLEAFFRWLGELLEPIGTFLKWIGSLFPDALYARIFLWTVLAVAGAALLWAIYNRFKHGQWRLRPGRRAAEIDDDIEEEWVPQAAPALSWLAEADALALAGRYDEAVHHLLFRTIDDIAYRRPNLVRPALTSRELAASPAIPSRARDLFGRIAGLVERGIFAGRPVDASDWVQAREAYAEFALAGSWRR